MYVEEDPHFCMVKNVVYRKVLVMLCSQPMSRLFWTIQTDAFRWQQIFHNIVIKLHLPYSKSLSELYPYVTNPACMMRNLKLEYADWQERLFILISITRHDHQSAEVCELSIVVPQGFVPHVHLQNSCEFLHQEEIPARVHINVQCRLKKMRSACAEPLGWKKINTSLTRKIVGKSIIRVPILQRWRFLSCILPGMLHLISEEVKQTQFSFRPAANYVYSCRQGPQSETIFQAILAVYWIVQSIMQKFKGQAAAADGLHMISEPEVSTLVLSMCL